MPPLPNHGLVVKSHLIFPFWILLIQSNGRAVGDVDRSSIGIGGASVGVGSRLPWPDDFFVIQGEASYQNYQLNNYQGLIAGLSNGTSHSIALGITLSRNSISDPISRPAEAVSLGVEFTPPFSSFLGINYDSASAEERYNWIEYHKWKFDAKQYIQLAKNLVIQTKVQFGFLGNYHPQLESPFERFYLGGDGLSGFGLDGREIVALRGYDNNSLSPQGGSAIYTKYNMELRYRISANPSATIFVLGFLEAGDAWNNFQEFRPFERKSPLEWV